jgi:L-amino acid N-acyltransferase YncA
MSALDGGNTPIEIEIRASRPEDLPATREIYAHHVLHGLASFEIIPPDVAELARRRDDVLARGLPHLVASRGGGVCGYAYAAPYRPRPAYRYTVEDSVYVAPEQVGKGVGRALLARLVELCEAAGYRQMVAVIGDRGNGPSIGLHAALGFSQVGLLPSVGLKFGRWVDIVIMQRALGTGDRDLPGPSRAGKAQP